MAGVPSTAAPKLLKKRKKSLRCCTGKKDERDW